MSGYLVYSLFESEGAEHNDVIESRADAYAQFELAISMGANEVDLYPPFSLYAERRYVKDGGDA